MNIQKYFWALRAVCYKFSFRKVGNLTYIGKPLYVSGRKNITIGNRVRIFPGARIEAIGDGTIEIGNNVVIEQNVHIISAGGRLYIGDNVTIAPNCFITNVNHEYRDFTKSVMDQKLIVKETTIGEGCFVGYGVAIQAGTKLGQHCIIGSNSVVNGNYEDGLVVVGIPAKTIKKYNMNNKTWEKV